jgi:Glycosyltransferase family 87
MEEAQPTSSHTRALWMCLALAFLLRLVVMVTTSGAGFDIDSYHIQAQSVFLHRNIYAFTDRYPYPPVWVWIVALAQGLANSSSVPFVWLVRLPATLGDCVIVALLQRYQGNKAALFYAVNPVSILITAGHGQFDGLVMAFVVVCWALWKKQRFNWAALALGVAVSLKVYPVLLLPALCFSIKSRRKQLLAAGLAFLPLVVSMLIYTTIFGLDSGMISQVASYGGTWEFGWPTYAHQLIPLIGPAPVTAVRNIAHVLLLGLPFLVIYLGRGWSLERLWLATFLGFYALSSGVAVQYLLWVVPLFALANTLRWGWFYSGLAAIAMVLFYLGNFPEVLPGGEQIAQFAVYSIWKNSYLLANLFWWLFCIFLWRRSLKQALPERLTYADTGQMLVGAERDGDVQLS